jgi:Protein of unknown function (DUF3383)
MTTVINTIPASMIASVVPSVISGGGTGLNLIELMLTTNNRVPIGSVLSFPTSASVGSFFGPTSNEAAEAAVYFSGFAGSTILPAALLFAQYPLLSVGAYLRGSNISALTLTALQALSGSLTVTIDGTGHTAASLNLSSATSFSSAAEIITAGLGLTGPTQAVVTGSLGAAFTATGSGVNLTVSSVTGFISANDVITGTGVPSSTTIVSQTSGTTGGAGVYVTSAATTASAAACTTSSTVLDVTAVANGTVAIGQEVTGASVTTGTFVTALGTGTGGVGTYTVTVGQHLAGESLTMVQPTVTFDSVSGAFIVASSTTGAASTLSFASGTLATQLGLTQAVGAVTSQGAVAATPSAFMASIIAQTTNWATFQTTFDPDQGSGNAQKLLFAQWVNSTGNRYAYLVWDTDITPTESTSATGSLGAIVQQDALSGVVPIYQPAGANLHLAAFVGGAIASINFNATNGRTTLAFRTQSGLVPSVTNGAVAANLIANGYNFFGIYATANDNFDFFYPGSLSGPFEWIDSYIDQIWLSSECQLALMTMLTQFGSIPYNPQGYGFIRAAIATPVQAAVNFGAIRQNVPLSAAQVSEVNVLAGMAIDSVLSTVGSYLVIQTASAQTRAARQSPTIILVYTDGQSVQQINLSSVLVQ